MVVPERSRGHRELAAGGLDAVAQTAQTGPVRPGTAPAVVGHPQAQVPVVAGDADLDDTGPRVLLGVDDRLAQDEPRGELEPGVEPVGHDLEGQGDR